jgi:dihydropteroate synthase
LAERLLFLTGHLAAPRLRRTLESLGPVDFSWEIADVGVKVAALMTDAIIRRRLRPPLPADRVIFPGRAGLDAEALSAHFGVPFERGPDEIADLPFYLTRRAAQADLSQYDITIFAEIVDAAKLEPEALLARARALAAEGADVIDLGCSPGLPFPHLEAMIARLQAEGLRVSVDSGDPDELARAIRAGADYVLSLTGETLHLARGARTRPILIPAAPGDLESLIAAAERAEGEGIAAILDPVLDPIHMGFTASLERYAALRRRLPGAEMLMGTGNLTELTDADSAGVTALLLGICSELGIRHVLTVQVSPHTRRTVAEHDVARRLMFAARRDGALPRLYTEALLQVHDRRPHPLTEAEIAEARAEVRDGNFRIHVTERAIHVFNNALHLEGREALALWEGLGAAVAGDAAHAFYLGAELAKAEIALRLGKRYVQDQGLDFGVADPTPRPARGAGLAHGLAPAGPTLSSAKEKRAAGRAPSPQGPAAEGGAPDGDPGKGGEA